MSRHISNDDLVRLLGDANAAQQAHMALLRTLGPCRLEPHMEDIEECPHCRHQMDLYRAIGRFLLWAIEKLESLDELDSRELDS